ncbi:MAG: hypothetical protein SFV21_16930 [Rhodospirillaceae bacterium]|nr:hypothetical protein [Rhodospirillaceae bacterium]
MIRELVLVRAGFSETPWFGRRPPPPPALVPGVRLEAITDVSMAAAFGDSPVPVADVARRLSDGDVCIGALSDAGCIVGQMWSADRPRWIDWIGATVTPPADHRLLYNAWVAPAWRGHGLQWALAAAACGDVVRRGAVGIAAGVERREYAPFARKYAALGLAVIVPFASVWALRLFGRALTWTATPPRGLSAATERARAMLARAASPL